MKLIIAGYIAAPVGKQAVAEYYGRLVQISGADGLEFSWNGRQTPAEIEETLQLLPDSWSITLNDMTGTYLAAVNNPTFGLGSPDADGRTAAIAMARDMNAGIKAMNDRAGRRVVLGVEIHSAPGFNHRVVSSDPDSFRRSIEELSTLEWDGSAVLVEHCDALIPDQTPAKGFLTLGDEIRVVSSLVGSQIGLSLNWGRSLVELRDPGRVVDHVVAAANSQLLKAFTFSGTAGTRNAYGEAWADSHLPFSAATSAAYSEPSSLMTIARVDQVLDYLDDCLFVAVKTGWPREHTNSMERAASVEANFNTLLERLRRHQISAGTM